MTELRFTVGGSLHCQPITSSPEQWPWQPLFSASEGRTFLGWFTYHQGSFKNTALGPNLLLAQKSTPVLTPSGDAFVHRGL